jgi:hypothetical protein
MVVVAISAIAGGPGSMGAETVRAACPSAPRSSQTLSPTWHAIGHNTGFSGAVGGVYAQIEKQSPPPFRYGSSPVEVVDYVMLKDPGAPSGWAWSQIG